MQRKRGKEKDLTDQMKAMSRRIVKKDGQDNQSHKAREEKLASSVLCSFHVRIIEQNDNKEKNIKSVGTLLVFSSV